MPFASDSRSLSFAALGAMLRIFPFWNMSFTISANNYRGSFLYVPVVGALVISGGSSARDAAFIFLIVFHHRRVNPLSLLGVLSCLSFEILDCRSY